MRHQNTQFRLHTWNKGTGKSLLSVLLAIALLLTLVQIRPMEVEAADEDIITPTVTTDKNIVGIGDTVVYTITVTMPASDHVGNNPAVTIKSTLERGTALSYINEASYADISNGTENYSNVTSLAGGETSTGAREFNIKFTLTSDMAGKTYKFRYSAKLANTATSSTTSGSTLYKNTVEVDRSDNSTFDGKNSSSVSASVKTVDVPVTSTYLNTNETFQIRTSENDESAAMSFVQNTEHTDYRKADTTTDTTTVTSITATSTPDTVTFHGFGQGTYYLVDTTDTTTYTDYTKKPTYYITVTEDGEVIFTEKPSTGEKPPTAYSSAFTLTGTTTDTNDTILGPWISYGNYTSPAINYSNPRVILMDSDSSAGNGIDADGLTYAIYEQSGTSYSGTAIEKMYNVIVYPTNTTTYKATVNLKECLNSVFNYSGTDAYGNTISLSASTINSIVITKTGNPTECASLSGLNANTTVITESGDSTDDKNIEQMFTDYINATVIDLRGYNTDNVTNMHSLFGGSADDSAFWSGNEEGCRNLRYVNMSGMNTKNCTLLDRMFNHCYKLKQIIVTKADPSNASSSGFNTALNGDFGYMFQDCIELRKLDLSFFNTDKAGTATPFDEDFYGGLVHGSFRMMFGTTSGIADMKLEYLDVTSFTLNYENLFPSGTSWKPGVLDMFGDDNGDCTNLRVVKIGTSFSFNTNGWYLGLGTRKTGLPAPTQYAGDSIDNTTKGWINLNDSNATTKGNHYSYDDFGATADDWGILRNKSNLNLTKWAGTWVWVGANGKYTEIDYNKNDGTTAAVTDSRIWWPYYVDDSGNTDLSKNYQLKPLSDLSGYSERTGYTLQTPAWDTKSDDTGTEYADGANLSSVTDVTADDSIATKQTMTLYERWQINTYTIMYDLNDSEGDSTAKASFNGSTTNPNSTLYTVETEDFTLTNPTRDGYEFLGWVRTDESATEAQKTTPVVTEKITKGTTGNRAYKAIWSKKYSITYKGVEGATFSEGDNPTTYTAETPDITLHNPTKSGYTFKGWTGTGIDGISTYVKIPTGSEGDRTYTANWTKNGETNSYTVTIPTSISWTGQPIGAVPADTSATYDIKVTGSYSGSVHVQGKITKKPIASGDTTALDMSLSSSSTNGLTYWDYEETQQDKVTLAGSTSSAGVYEGTITYTATQTKSDSN